MTTPDTTERNAPATAPLPFRREALEAQRGVAWLGEISLIRPLASWVLTATAAAVAGVVLALLLFGRYADRARVNGQLLPVQGVTTLHAPAQGAVERVLVEEGAYVRRGDILAVLGHPRSAPESADVSVVQRGLLQTRGRSLKESSAAELALIDSDERRSQAQRAGLEEEIGAAQRELSLRREQLSGLEDIARRFDALGSSKHAGALQVREAQGRVLSQRAEIEVLQRQLGQLRARRNETQQTLAAFETRRDAVRAAFDRDHAGLEQEDIVLALQAQSAIRAPIDGLVAARLVEPGQGVGGGAPLLVLMAPDDTLEAHLMVPSRAIAQAQPGSAVRLRYPAYPYQRYGHFHGRVLRVSHAALDRDGDALSPSGSDSHYRVVVAIDAQRVMSQGRDERLLPGMAVEADLFGESRRLVEWLLGPLDAIETSLASPST